jgi:H+-transporting ATPase
MTPIGWGWALLVWGYALAWFLINDQITVVASKILDRLSVKQNAKETATIEAA